MKTAENSKERSTDDLLKNLKVVRPSVKQRVTDAKEPKESKYKLDFDFPDNTHKRAFMTMASSYADAKRSQRLGVLFAPMSYGGNGFQASLIIIHALSFMADLKLHSDAEFNAMIESRNTDDCFFDSFDEMLMGDVCNFCKVIEAYAKNLKRPDGKTEGVTLEEWARFLPREKEEAKFVAQLLCDGGINKYDLSCAGLGKNLLNDINDEFGLATPDEAREYFAELEKDKEGQN